MVNEEAFRKFYINQPGDFYAIQSESKGLRHLWFKKRQFMIKNLVERYWQEGAVVDLGCGNCVWKRDNISVVGIDICENMLRYNVLTLEKFYPLKADLYSHLPFKNENIRLVVITEVLEHFVNYRFLLKEIKRILKEKGILIGSVPYGKFPGLWWILFPIWCLYKGIRDNDKYYLNKCGHRVSFSPTIIKNILKAEGFRLLEIKILGGLTIFFVAEKVDA